MSAATRPIQASRPGGLEVLLSAESSTLAESVRFPLEEQRAPWTLNASRAASSTCGCSRPCVAGRRPAFLDRTLSLVRSRPRRRAT